MSFDYNTVISACKFSIIGAIVSGFLGFYIGKVLETPKRHIHRQHKHKSKKNKPTETINSTNKETEEAETQN